MLIATARGLLVHAAPVLIAQLSSIGMMVVDTAVLGHVSPADLAAVAIGGGIHVSVVFALVGILQAVAPVVAQLRGAGRDQELARVLQQGFWLALGLCLPGMIFLKNPGLLLGVVAMAPDVEGKVRDYLGLLAWGLPAALCYRTFYAFSNAVGKPFVLMAIGLASLGTHAILAWGLAQQGWFGVPRGVLGCALSNLIIGWLACLAGAIYLRWSAVGQRYRPFANWSRPHWPTWHELLRLGIPMGLSNLIEITSFTLISLFIASLGATVVAGHRIVANLSALAYMLPLSLAIATMVAVGQAVGAHDLVRAKVAIRAGMMLAGGLSTLLGVLLWLFAQPLVDAYTDDLQIRAVAIGLILYLAVYQFFDALQTVASHALRAYRITFLPMLVQIICFWGVGLAGGAWLCFRWSPAMGVAGFWLANMLGLVLAASLLLPLLKKVIAATESAA